MAGAESIIEPIVTEYIPVHAVIKVGAIEIIATKEGHGSVKIDGVPLRNIIRVAVEISAQKMPKITIEAIP